MGLLHKWVHKSLGHTLVIFAVTNAVKTIWGLVFTFVVAALLGSLMARTFYHSRRGTDHMLSLLDVSLLRAEVLVRTNRLTTLADGSSLQFLKATLAEARLRTLHDLVEDAEAQSGPSTSTPRKADLFFSDGSKCSCWIESYTAHRGLRLRILWSQFDADETTYDMVFQEAPPPPLANLLDDMFDGTETKRPRIIERAGGAADGG